MCAGVWGFSVNHLNCCDTQRPDVCLEIISSLLDYFRRHPERGSDECIALRLDVDELGSDTKVSQLHFASLGKQNIGCLDVAVDLAFAVQIIQAQKEFSADDGHMGFVETSWFQL